MKYEKILFINFDEEREICRQHADDVIAFQIRGLNSQVCVLDMDIFEGIISKALNFVTRDRTSRHAAICCQYDRAPSPSPPPRAVSVD